MTPAVAPLRVRDGTPRMRLHCSYRALGLSHTGQGTMAHFIH